ncbi:MULTISPECIES: LacI family DNA-binding transcriptional regulator [Rhizobium]|nr:MULTISPECIES: LacI family DNA-binding transcriptional regulator [Rhizobium]NKK62167.1 LacI family DNA-binding transcriptional regulator [Rhizobium leguminosarum bv. viciae]NKL04226.1 LacI family DNA-binding transcriptional regulator [Rhizobium leguminosarum bv. viciae]NKL86800.1 LacI family DNA-binding transcriptional regulator [Rhizobium leguminosarum bv. viciae]NKL89390.1 LacI family DNA-binding transcriptional regulator [Rhizobium leguminosarum bv. viciae]NKM90357.1 LacI family DNA-bindi
MRRTPTIIDVAQRAGVSPSTVSRALMKPELVSEQTRATIEAAVDAIGYRINVGAQNLRRQRTRNIVVLTPNLQNSYYFDVLAGISSAVTDAGFNLLIGDGATIGALGNDFDVRHYLDSSLADGIILMDSTYLGGLAASPDKATRIPIVLASLWLEDQSIPSVRVDNIAGSGLAVDHLVSLGHHKIGHVRGPTGVILAKTREEGFCKAMAAHNLPVREDWLVAGGSSLQAGKDAADIWLAMPPEDRPSAIYCYSDNIAIGLMGSLQQKGLSIPRDLSLVGFDGIELGTHLAVPLTTIEQPRFEIGKKSAAAVINIIETPDAPPQELHTILPVQLVVRNSTARI